MRDFFLHAPTRLFFGKRSLAKAGRICKSLGHTRLLLVTGQHSAHNHGGLAELVAGFEKHGLQWRECPGVAANPSLEHVTTILDAARDHSPHALFALGGGSVIDACKVAAAALLRTSDPWEMFKEGRDVLQALPLYAASTLAGSGSECNAEAVLGNRQSGEILGLRGPALSPLASFVDPVLQAHLPWELTRRGAADAFSHVMERYVLAKQEHTAPALAETLLRCILKQTEELRRTPMAYEPRSELCWAAILAQNNALLAPLGAGDWTVHVLAHAVTAHAPHVAHGDAVAALLPAWLELLAELTPGALDRWSKEVFEEENSARGVARLRTTFSDWDFPTSREELGLDADTLAAAARQAQAQGRRHNGLGRVAAMEEHVSSLLERAFPAGRLKPEFAGGSKIF